MIVIFTGKYGKINLKMKITYCPTLPCEYNNSTIPNITTGWRDLHVSLKHRRMPQEGHKATRRTQGHKKSKAEQPGRG